MNPKLEKWIFRLAALAWMGMVTWFSHQPGSKVQIDHPIDKIIHCGTFGVMGSSCAWERAHAGAGTGLGWPPWPSRSSESSTSSTSTSAKAAP
jgi:hypothetical protein